MNEAKIIKEIGQATQQAISSKVSYGSIIRGEDVRA